MSVELLFMPSVYAPCPTCHGSRFHESTLKVLFPARTSPRCSAMSVDQACEFFAEYPDHPSSLRLLQDIGSGISRSSDNQRLNCREARPNASSSPPSCNAFRGRDLVRDR